MADYGRFDFPALWKGRGKVTEVEETVLARELARADRRRILEVGTGFGRLLGALATVGEEVVATDFDSGSLGRLTVDKYPALRLRVAANLYHLPFVDGSFTSATMIRVYHHLSDPGAALRELARVLRKGSRLILSYNPKPSVGTLVNDIQRALHPSGRHSFRSITFARGPIALDPDPFPVFVAGRRDFSRTARAAGFQAGPETGSGLEEYYFMRHVPTDWFVRFGTVLARAPTFPSRFALLERGGTDTAPLPKLPEILACPRCRTPQPSWAMGAPLECHQCAYVGKARDGVLDLRFVPPAVERWEAHSRPEVD